MAILLWLLPAAVVTLLAMAWVSWAGRTRPEPLPVSSDEDARERIARALARENPAIGRVVPAQRVEPSSGVVVRPSRSRPE